jgi:hypothetical protein
MPFIKWMRCGKDLQLNGNNSMDKIGREMVLGLERWINLN